MTQSGRASGRFMMITPERVFYAGLLGRPRQRISGGLNIYVAHEGLLTLNDHLVCRRDVIVVPPYVAHSVSSDHPHIICLVIEPETVEPCALRDVAALVANDLDFAAHVRSTCRALHDAPLRDLAPDSFDRTVFGAPLPRRRIDPRIAAAIAMLNAIDDAKIAAADCADVAGLSPSRFLHLFKQETGVAFRAFRAWKRARHLLHFVNEDVNMAHLAQRIGYPDSTHFSHSIRRFYGLKPRAIFNGSRDLAIVRAGALPA